MPQIPQFNREEKLNGTALPYQNYQMNDNTFGVSIGRAVNNISNSMNIALHTIDRINEYQEHIKGMEFNNAIEDWKQQKLYDKENGYFLKQGKDASGKTEEIMQDYDDFVQEWQSKNKLTNFNQARLEQISKYKRSGILQNVTAHDLKQTQTWASVEGSMGINNAITDAVSDRNNEDGIALQIGNIKQITQWQGEVIGLDADSIKAAEFNNVSNAYCAILDAKLQDGDISAKEFFSKHKNDIDSKMHAKYIGAIKNMNDKYLARDLANKIVATSGNLQEATAKYEAIKDVEMSDAVGARVRAHYSQEDHFKREEQKELLNDFYTKAVDAAQNGTALTFDDIPEGLEPQTKYSLMNFINKNGGQDNDEQTWDYLYNMSVNNAQGFANEDLNKYRGYLTDGQYQSFVKRQQQIKDGAFYTTIKDDDEMIEQALESCGLSGGFLRKHDKTRNVFYSETSALVRELEARKGRKINNEELQNIINSLGYKDSNGVQIYKLIEKGMGERNGFIRDVMNDFVYYQNQHNGQMPSNEEKSKIINRRMSAVIVKQNNGLQTSLTQPRQYKEGDRWNGHIITSPYGLRVSPKTGATTDHKGVDLAYGNNEIFTAYASGVVVNKGFDSHLGNFVDIKSSDGIIHRYGHANKILVEKGDPIKAGQNIGRAGSTGVATGPHVHYAKIKNGKFINPLYEETTQIANSGKGWAF